MRKNLILICGFAALLTVISCEKSRLGEATSPAKELEEIVLRVGDGFEATVDTRATAVTAVPATLFWGATTGSGSETQKWAAASGSVSSGKISTGKYQTKNATAYNYYVANQTFSVGSSTTMTVSGNETDIIAGRTAASSSTTPSVTLNHIFARTGTLTLNTQAGYTLSGVSWKIVGKGDINGTAGTYNMTTGAWTAASTKLSADTAVTSSSDMYLIPGTYTVKVTYTLTKGDYTDTFTKSADVTLVGGKINNITGTAVGGSATEIILSVSLTAWGSNDIAITLPE